MSGSLNLILKNEIETELYDIKEWKRESKNGKDEKAEEYWNNCLGIIRDNVTTQVFRTWFEPIKALSWHGNQLVVQVPSQFFCEWIEEHYYPLLQKTINQVLGDDAALQYEIVVDENNDTLDKRTIKIPAFRYPPTGKQGILPFAADSEKSPDFNSNLNPRYSFDNFVKGESNQLASSAAWAVAQNPGGTRFNPLVIYGETGLGKTHLVQGIGNFIALKNSRLKVLYTTSEHFTQEFINAIQNNKVNEFISFYRSIDTLIVDDIQFFAGKEKTQDNFFHTFNALHQAGKQLILTSDKPPRDLDNVDDRLISRFQWGLIVDIQPPDFETRMAILQKKSIDEGFELPSNIIEYLAKNISSSVRELEGSLISVIAKVTLDRRELSLDLAKEVVYGIGGSEPKPLTIDEIKQSVADYYKLSVDTIESKSRKHEITLARQMSMFLAKQLTQLSLKSIGASFGNRDHSTVLHLCQTIENYFATDSSIKIAYETLKRKLSRA